MNKLRQRYHRYMIRPILYKCISRLITVITLGLLWLKFVNRREEISLIGYFFPIAGVLLIAFSWFYYLKLDGVQVPLVRRENKRKKFFLLHTMIDHTQEEVVSFSNMDAEDRTACMLLVYLIDGLVLLLVSMADVII